MVVQPPPGRIRFVSGSSVADLMWTRYAPGVRRKKSKQRKPISANQRESDDKLRRELENADPEKFKRLVKPLFRSQKTGGNG